MADRDIRVGGHRIPVATAAAWISRYFDEKANMDAASVMGGNPYAYPLYDRMDTGSGPDELNDGDLLAPLLVNAGPTIKAVFNLQAVRPELEAALTRVPLDLTLQSAVADGVHRPLLEPLVRILDRPGGVPGVRGTTLMKILHRKRPHFVPLYDSRVYDCYCGTSGDHPLRPDRKRTWVEFFAVLAEAMVADLDSQPQQWKVIAVNAPEDVSLLRVLDVVAWNLGRDRADEASVHGDVLAGDVAGVV
ncbi:DUF6308 family protein [Streptomyces sp. NPDC048496]|uniref:DUF6308 family protein n=1 Tax=Streptomyces sp. NPDC048496 TaxID=3365558 RepID=UPI003713AA6C